MNKRLKYKVVAATLIIAICVLSLVFFLLQKEGVPQKVNEEYGLTKPSAEERFSSSVNNKKAELSIAPKTVHEANNQQRSIHYEYTHSKDLYDFYLRNRRDSVGAEANYLAAQAIRDCFIYTNANENAEWEVKLLSLPNNDLRKRRLAAFYELTGRCKRFIGKYDKELWDEAERLIQKAITEKDPAALSEHMLMQYKGVNSLELLKDMVALAETKNPFVLDKLAALFKVREKKDYWINDEGENFRPEVLGLASHSLACEYGYDCQDQPSYSTKFCWKFGDCNPVPFDERVRSQILPPVEYEQYLRIKDILRQSIEQKNWPSWMLRPRNLVPDIVPGFTTKDGKSN